LCFPTLSQQAVHDEGVDVALRRVVEGAGQTAHDFEPEFLPEADRSLIAADHDIELHGAEAAVAGVVQGMGTHDAGDAAAGGCGCGHVSAIGDMAAPALLIRTKIIGAENFSFAFSIFFRNKYVVMGCIPIAEGLLAGEVTREGIGFPCADGGF